MLAWCIGLGLLQGFGASLAGAQGEAGELVADAAPPEPADEMPAPELFEGVTYLVTRFELGFLVEPPNAPDISALRKTQITLGTMEMAGEQGGVFVPPEASQRQVQFSLDELPTEGPTRFAAAALASVDQQIVEALSRQGLGSIIVAPDEEDIGFTTGQDLRAEGETSLRLTIFLPTIKELQSFATGERVAEDDATNNPVHSRILEQSPVHAGELFWPRDVDDYVARLNRHSGRRVVAQLSPSHDQQQLYLDYQIAESKPWVAYTSVSSTGARATGVSQVRLGFVHLQPTDRDDILSVDYVMNTNAKVRAVNASYQLPLWIDTLRLEIDAGYVDFEATSDEGLSFDEDASFILGFEGMQARGGLQFAYNFFQRDEYFLDLLAGATFEYIETKISTESDFQNANDAGLTSGRDEFLTAHVGVGLERKDPKLKLVAMASVDFSTLGHDMSSGSSFHDLGRTEPDENPIVLRWDSSLAFFVDALLADPKNPAPIHAHEVVVRYRGQSAFDKYRLIPHHQQIGGGMDTVRGYDQGVTAGDSVHLASLEYRFHLPRLFKPHPDTTQFPLIGEFAIAPRGPGERPDWDWVLKVFYDVGSMRQTDRLEDVEFDDVLQGIGVGTELFFKRNMQLRLDWGLGLEAAHCSSQTTPRCEIPKNEWEINFSASFFY